MTRSKRRIPGDTKLAIGYLRVSKAEGQELGPDAQRAAIEAWAMHSSVAVVAWFEEHLCGATAIEDRPELLAAIDALAEQGAGVMVVAKRDRLARDVIASAMIERLAERNGARVVSAAGEGTDGDDPSSMLMRRMVDAFAEYERRIIIARTRAALAVKKSRKERTGSVPFGASLAADGRMLLENGSERAIIEEARRLRERGLSLRRVASRLGKLGMVSRSGKPFGAKQIARMIPS
jgi:DNA invertase Pin-like site-specific DNA recombinase